MLLMENKYTESQLKESGLEYFSKDLLATNVWLKKYALKEKNTENYLEKSPDETIQRVAHEIHRIEQKYKNSLSYEEIYDALKNFGKFIFGGSILFGVGNKDQVSSLGNCFFIDNGADSYGGIFNIDESLVQLMKRRGGVGITLEHLRPASAGVNNAAQSSTGATSFMDRYSNSTREVAQDGRRGALMITMHVNHPDIIDFIMKKDDLAKVTGANVSVKVTDEFMRAVENDEDYVLRFPVESVQPHLTEQLSYNKLHKMEDGTYVRRVKAREVWNTIVRQAHKNAEPGVLFWDNVIKESPADMYADLGFKTLGTNPCIVGDTLIAIADGRNAVSIKTLAEEDKDVPVYSTNPITGKTEIKWARNPRLTKRKAEVWKLILDDGSELIATPDHGILTSKLQYKSLKDLIPGESLIPFYSFNSNGYRQISRVGANMSGGNFRNRRQYQIIHEFYKGIIDHKLNSIHHRDFDQKNDHIENLEKLLRPVHQELHAALMRGDKNPYHKMSDKWKFDFASHPGKENPLYINVSNADILKAGKKLFAEKGKITRKEWMAFAKENNYPTKLANDFRFESFTNFKNQVATNHKVVSAEFYGYEDVYNITVDDNHNYHIINKFSDPLFITSSGICVKNCGEVPLSPYDSCRLGSINLYTLVEDPFTPDAQIDWSELAYRAHLAQRFMDDIVDLEEEKIIQIIAKIDADKEPDFLKRVEKDTWEKVLDVLRKGRRTGIGVLGLGDMLAAIGVKFGTPEATKIAEEIQKIIAVNSYRESVKLAEERGCFPIWNADKEAGNPFIRRIISENFDNKEYKNYLVHGRRNIATISIAPTGTLALICQCTSGIEPVFKIFYRRRRKINPNETGTKVSFTDENGDCWEEYNVIHYPFITWFQMQETRFTFNGARTFLEGLDEEAFEKLVATSPWAGAESHAIDYIEKIKMQGAIQKWVDHSISVTHNLPEKITLKEVNDIYFQGWKSGCKGLTIYREGSRTGVLISKKEVEDFKENHAPKRPKTLEADYFVVTVKGIKFAVIVGLWPKTNRPFEVFAFENPPSLKNTRGVITKVKKGHYKFVNGEFEIPNLNLAAGRVEERTLTLSASMLLRHGAPIKYVNHVITKIDENVTSFSSALRRCLTKYIDEPEGEVCPNCGEKLIMQDGCVKCFNEDCGYSRCG